MVMVGGELTLEALGFRVFAVNRLLFSAGPGSCQRRRSSSTTSAVSARRATSEPLIVPLESRVDFLTLKTGQKFELPFMVLVVFATNIRPAELVDEAFLRRIHYKVFAESPTIADFKRIFANVCRERDITYDEQIVEGLLATQTRRNTWRLAAAIRAISSIRRWRRPTTSASRAS